MFWMKYINNNINSETVCYIATTGIVLSFVYIVMTIPNYKINHDYINKHSDKLLEKQHGDKLSE